MTRNISFNDRSSPGNLTERDAVAAAELAVVGVFWAAEAERF
jgi:hypothetical protein